MLSSRVTVAGPLAARAKRFVDVTLASVLIVLISPLLLAIALLVKLTSRGPAIFKQRRLGLRCEPFTMWKFRTMIDAPGFAIPASDAPPAAFVKSKDDPRITALGHVLRKYSLDELPQLFNVVQGKMSLIGPRPLRECDVVNVPHCDTLRRFATLPGITGLWQVSGRSNLTGVDALRMDRKYIDRWCPCLDCKILWKTVGVVLRGKDSA